MNKELKDRVLSKINRDEVIKLVMDLVDIPSPPGAEAGAGEFILGWLCGHGLESVRQEVEPGRLNAVGILKGSGRGTSLMFNGHLDTSHPGTEEEIEAAGASAASLHARAFLEGDALYGLGSYNCKGPVATALIALKALKESGVTLDGDVVVAAVCGEIGVAPVGRYQGPAYHGNGYGTRYLVTHGVITDLAVVVEPSYHQLVWSLPGVLLLKVTTYGESAYIPFINRARWEKEGTNGVRNTIRMLQVIEDWAVEYEAKNKLDSPGGPVTGRANIGAIEAGRPYKPNYSIASCTAYLDIKVPPSRGMLDVQRELEGVLAKAGLEARVEAYLSHRGYEGKGNEALVEGGGASLLPGGLSGRPAQIPDRAG
ncbi:MAG: M20/M25/M40 family metallo-hydrolase [Chloroflexota bacterium]